MDLGSLEISKISTSTLRASRRSKGVEADVVVGGANENGASADGVVGDSEVTLRIALGGGEFAHALSGAQKVESILGTGLPVVRLMTVPLSVPA